MLSNVATSSGGTSSDVTLQKMQLHHSTLGLHTRVSETTVKVVSRACRSVNSCLCCWAAQQGPSGSRQLLRSRRYVHSSEYPVCWHTKTRDVAWMLIRLCCCQTPTTDARHACFRKCAFLKEEGAVESRAPFGMHFVDESLLEDVRVRSCTAP